MVNEPALTAVPLGVVTRQRPSVAPTLGIVAVIDVGEVTVNVAFTYRSVTELTLTKFVPVRVTVVPTRPLAGAKLEIVGAPTGAVVTVNEPLLVAVPADVVTDQRAGEATPAGTLAEIEVAETAVNVAATVPSLTDVAPDRFVPVSVTVAPTGPLEGLKPVTVGGAGAAVVM
jgi:hypothetical protein